MAKCFGLVLLSALFAFGLSAKLPPEFKICKRSDPSLNECLKEAIIGAFHLLKNGLPALNVPSIEPVNVPSVTIGEGKGAVHVQQKYKNVDIHNVTLAKIESVEVSTDPFKITMKINSPQYTLTADYDFNGRLLLLPIVGVGRCTIILDNTKTDIILTGEKIEKKGVTYMKIKDFKIILKPEKVHYNFENLFNGDEKLGKQMNDVLNENWKEVYEDVEPGYEEFIGSIGKHIANTIFTKVPYDDLFPPK